MSEPNPPEERRKRGRPRLSAEPLSHLSTRIPTEQHERLASLATRERVTLSEYVRRIVTERTPDFRPNK